MTVKFEVFSYKGGPNPTKVLIMLELLGYSRSDYVVHNLDFGAHPLKGIKSDFFKRITPNQRVPALVDHRNNHFIVWESGAILQYLARQYGQDQFIGKDLEEQTITTIWLDFQISGHGPMQGQVNFFRHFWKNATGEDVPPLVLKRYVDECYRVFSVLEEQLTRQKAAGSSFLALDRLTIADISTHSWLRTISVAELSLDNYPLLKAYTETIEKMPATQRAVASQLA